MRDLFRMFMDAGISEERVERMEVWQAAHYCRPADLTPAAAVAHAHEHGERRARGEAIAPMDPRANQAHGARIAAALEASRRARTGVN